eukprot:5638059-Prymnesium_polylepis.1
MVAPHAVVKRAAQLQEWHVRHDGLEHAEARRGVEAPPLLGVLWERRKRDGAVGSHSHVEVTGRAVVGFFGNGGRQSGALPARRRSAEGGGTSGRDRAAAQSCAPSA